MTARYETLLPLKRHGMLTVQLLPAELPDVRTGCPVARVIPALGPDQKVAVQTEAGQEHQYDAVIMATHSDISKALLEKAAPKVS